MDMKNEIVGRYVADGTYIGGGVVKVPYKLS
jgi:hypothetical protein